MALTESLMLELGTKVPDFTLSNTNRNFSADVVSVSDFSSAPALLITFICNHCPYVIHLKRAFAQFAREYSSKGLATVAISANDPSTHPADSPSKMTEDADKYTYVFPYLFDETQQVAVDFNAVCTPEFYLFDSNRLLVYRGQFDSSRPGNDVPITGVDLINAVDAVLNDEEVSSHQVPSIGCNIKWKAGTSPSG